METISSWTFAAWQGHGHEHRQPWRTGYHQAEWRLWNPSRAFQLRDGSFCKDGRVFEATINSLSWTMMLRDGHNHNWRLPFRRKRRPLVTRRWSRHSRIRPLVPSKVDDATFSGFLETCPLRDACRLFIFTRAQVNPFPCETFLLPSRGENSFVLTRIAGNFVPLRASKMRLC